MSGGSYDYLFAKWADDLFDMDDTLERTFDRLTEMKDAEDVARETYEVITTIRATRIRLQVHINRLQDVWRAVEWCDWGDSGEDDIRAAIAAYRGETDESEATADQQ